jgi:hypothetical protein
MRVDDNFFTFIRNKDNIENINNIITNINNSKVNHYLVEQKNSKFEGFTIRLLNDDTTNVNLNGTFDDLSIKETLD